MPTYAEINHEIQGKVLDSIHIGQKGVIDWVRSCAEVVETISKHPEPTHADSPPKPGQAFESMLEFTEKVVTSYWEFLFHVFDAAWPVTKTAPAATAKAAKATSDKS